MEAIGESGIIANMEWVQVPIEIVLCGIILTFAIPMCCAIFPQISPVSIDKLEPELQVIHVLLFASNTQLMLLILSMIIIILVLVFISNDSIYKFKYYLIYT